MNYLDIVSCLLKVSKQDILSDSQKQNISEARQFCMYFYRKEIGAYNTGEILKRNHSTVVNGSKRISGLISVGDKRTLMIASQISEIEKSRKEINFNDGVRNL